MKKRNMFIADGVWERLKALAVERGMPVAQLVRQSLYEFLKREEKQ